MSDSKPANKVITRFAPSPTGFLHMGGARTALFNHLLTKKHGGRAILRIEDTDKARSTKEYEASIIDSLEWLGLGFDQTFKQSDREEIYKKYLKKLIDEDKAFKSDETQANRDAPRKDGLKVMELRNEVIRFRNPNKKIKFNDLIRGEVEFDTTELGDFVIAKSLEEPLYHLAVVVDDFEMKITHVVRGEDHISNTPRQILIQEAIGAPRPVYAHLPIILAADKSKLSKRKHGEAVSVDFYRQKGYIPEAIINFLALLGWNPGTDQEIFTIEELKSLFDMAKVQKSGAVFNTEKLDWLDRQYLVQLNDEQFAEKARPFLPEGIDLKRLIPILKEKIAAFGDIAPLFDPHAGELRFVKAQSEYSPESLLWKKNPDKSLTAGHLKECRALIEKVSTANFNAESVKAAVWPYAEAKGKGEVLWPLRMALTGQEKSPDPFMCAAILGREESLKRIDAALSQLS